MYCTPKSAQNHRSKTSYTHIGQESAKASPRTTLSPLTRRSTIDRMPASTQHENAFSLPLSLPPEKRLPPPTSVRKPSSKSQSTLVLSKDTQQRTTSKGVAGELLLPH